MITTITAATTTTTKSTAGISLPNTLPEFKTPPIIKSIYASGSYSAAVSSSGDLYTWGCSDGNQLGHSVPRSNNHSNIPRIDTSGPISQTAGLRTRDAQSFDSRLNVLIPRRVECLIQYGLKVESLSTGPHFMVAICSKLDQKVKDESDKEYLMGKTLYEHERDRRDDGINRIRVLRNPLSADLATTADGALLK
mmetsp:Transcript_26082/g.32170  ORF Transcript_26082/g.32170 Transcript_26082/m.32170 type:complete len:194 (-) Transcript_26082:252-833(-)